MTIVRDGETPVVKEPAVDAETKEEPYLGTFKDKDAAEEGLKNLNSKIGDMGREKGELAAQLKLAQSMITNMQSQKPQEAAKPENKAPDYAKEITSLRKDMSELNPVDEDYQPKMIELSDKISNLTAASQHEKTLSAAKSEFTKILDQRDTESNQNQFYGENPAFQNPEMQVRIQERVANDRTGMTDPLVAFREIERDDAQRQLTQSQEEITRLSELLNLKKGAEITGKVITKSGQSLQNKTNIPKVTGAEFDAGMQATLDALRA